MTTWRSRNPRILEIIVKAPPVSEAAGFGRRVPHFQHFAILRPKRDSRPGPTLGWAMGPIVSQVTLRSFLRSPATGGAENDPRVTWDTMGPPKLPKVQPGILVHGGRGNVYECLWWHGRRSRAMTRNALEINRNERVGSLRFSLWKPSPLCILVLKASACGFRIFIGVGASRKSSKSFS